MAITTTAKVKSWLNITDTNKDSLIAELIVDIQGVLESMTGRQFDAEDVVEYYDGEGSDVLYLKRYPVNSIASLYDDIGRDFDANSLIDSDDYYFDTETGRLALLGGLKFTRGRGNVKVTYNGGYGTIPADLDYCAKRIIAEILKLGRAMNQTPVTPSQNFVRNVMEKDNQVARIVEIHRRVAIG